MQPTGDHGNLLTKQAASNLQKPLPLLSCHLWNKNAFPLQTVVTGVTDQTLCFSNWFYSKPPASTCKLVTEYDSGFQMVANRFLDLCVTGTKITMVTTAEHITYSRAQV